MTTSLAPVHAAAATDTAARADPTIIGERYGHFAAADARRLTDGYARAIHTRQRGYLRNLVRLAFPHGRPVQHDYACGAGRGIRLLYPVVRAAHGYDTSTAALVRARQHAPHARLHQISPWSQPLPAAAPTPAVVTMFDLWQAGAATWKHAMAFASRVLTEPAAGLLMLENDTYRGGPRDRDIVRLLDRYGFEVVLRRGFAVLPPRCYQHPLLRLVVRLADDLAARCAWIAGYRGRVCYVARRMPRLRPLRHYPYHDTPTNPFFSKAPASSGAVKRAGAAGAVSGEDGAFGAPSRAREGERQNVRRLRRLEP